MGIRASVSELVQKYFGYSLPSYVTSDQTSKEDWQTPTYEWYLDAIKIGHSRQLLYTDVEEMDNYSDICAALDIYSDDACQHDYQTSRTIWVDSADNFISDTLNEMFDNLQFEDYIWGFSRSLAKYGDLFLRNYIKEDDGIVHLEWCDPKIVSRDEDKFRVLRGYQISSKTSSKNPADSMFQPWEITHFKVPGRYIQASYGESMLNGARLTWKQLKLMEDAVLLYRLRHAPDRMIFKIDIGAMPIEEGFDLLNRYKALNRKHRFVDPSSKEFRTRNNPLGSDSDIYFPTRPNSNSDVTKIPGSANVSQIYDIEYMMMKLYGSLKIPKAYMSQEKDSGWKSGAALSQQDLRYARTVRRLQRGMILGARRLCNIHLAAKGIDPYKHEFAVRMTNVSNLDELQEVTILKEKLEAAKGLAEVAESLGVNKQAMIDFVFESLLSLPEETVKKLRLIKAEKEGSEEESKKVLDNLDVINEAVQHYIGKKPLLKEAIINDIDKAQLEAASRGGYLNNKAFRKIGADALPSKGQKSLRDQNETQS